MGKVSVHRNRGQRIFIGEESIGESRVEFWLGSGRKLHFWTSYGYPLLCFGVHVEARGEIRMQREFKFHDISIELAPPAAPSGRLSPFIDGDRDRALEQAVSTRVRSAAERLVALSVDTVASAWMDLADDYILDRLAYREHCLVGRKALGENISYKDERFYDDQEERILREIGSVDEEAYATSWLHATRPGYVVVCDGRLADRGEGRFRNDRGAGWIQRHVCVHFTEALRFAKELGREENNIQVERIRIIEGEPYVVTAESLSAPTWRLDEPILTGTLSR